MRTFFQRANTLFGYALEKEKYCDEEDEEFKVRIMRQLIGQGV